MKKFVFLFLIMFSFSFIGCTEYIQGIGTGKPVKLMPKTIKYDDFSFVIPANFKFKDSDSIIYSIDGKTRGYLVYYGNADQDQLVRFLKKYLTQQGWQEMEIVVSGNNTLAVFKKERKLLIIKAEKRLSLLYLRILLTAL